jgi:hypothetical protein
MNVEIPVKRTRIPFAFIGWMLLAVLFIFLIVNNNHSDPYYYYKPLYYLVSGYTILMSGIALIDYLKTLFDKNAKLVLSEKAFYDNLSILSFGSIPWENITGVELIKLKRFNSHFIVIKLNDTDKYLASRNFLFRSILKRYLRAYGGIVVISELRMDYDINQLKEEITERCSFPKYK